MKQCSEKFPFCVIEERIVYFHVYDVQLFYMLKDLVGSTWSGPSFRISQSYFTDVYTIEDITLRDMLRDMWTYIEQDIPDSIHICYSSKPREEDVDKYFYTF